MTYEQAGRLADVAAAQGIPAWRRNNLGLIAWSPERTHHVELVQLTPEQVAAVEQYQREYAEWLDSLAAGDDQLLASGYSADYERFAAGEPLPAA